MSTRNLGQESLTAERSQVRPPGRNTPGRRLWTFIIKIGDIPPIQLTSGGWMAFRHFLLQTNMLSLSEPIYGESVPITITSTLTSGREDTRLHLVPALVIGHSIRRARWYRETQVQRTVISPIHQHNHQEEDIQWKFTETMFRWETGGISLRLPSTYWQDMDSRRLTHLTTSIRLTASLERDLTRQRETIKPQQG